ncbi:uncharacterized protein LOC124114812 isoform X2 [Haliotis rufescens]|uniref:uncharacterized protein LOC124114812 isoform X2 n=1 Tax=Haliotis rufescens TaxID=6454 RepID=UPI001EAFB22D|nr:uncharacterized protein LOC124114812 isoform X2 [Haliotis rufescens]
MKKVAIIVIVVIVVIIVVVTDQVHTTETATQSQQDGYHQRVLVMDPLQRPENVKCVFHAKKTVNCTYDVPNNTEHNFYTCYVGACYQNNWNPNNTTCTDPGRRQKLQNTTIPRQCNFDCHPPGAVDQCLEDAFIIIISGRQPNKEVSYCSSFNLKQIEKPGPVGNLGEVKIGLSFIKLTWTKPDPDDKDGYNYTLRITGGPKGSRELHIHKKRYHVKKRIKGLSAWTSYNITVTADRAYRGDPTTINVRTEEDVPLSSPVIPSGSFSVINSTTLMLYPKSVPKEEQQGEIIRYETMTNNYTSFYSLLVERENGGGCSVSLRAATKKGLSGHRTNFTVSRQDLETQSIDYVYQEDGVLKWKVLRAEKYFRVYYCHGKMKKNMNVARCQDEIQHQDVASRMQIKEEDLDCDPDCLYAVSGRGHSRAGMVWSSDKRTVVVKVDGPGTGIIVTGVVVLVVLIVAVAIALGGCCYFMKKKGMCSNYVIHLPEFKHHLLDNKFDTKEDVTTPKHKPLRDSGNASMGTDASLAAVMDKGAVREREMSGVSHPSDPTIKCDADHPEIHEESSEARKESSRNPGKASASGGLHPSAGGLHPSAGGAHPSAGGLHPSAGGAHPSVGGLHPSTGGAHPSTEGSQQIPGTSAEDVTEESLWDNSGQSCVSEYRQFAAIGDGSVQDSSKEEHDDLIWKYCDEQTIDHCLPLSGSVSFVASSCSQSGPSASSYSAVLIPLDSSCKESRHDSSSQESSSQESRHDSSSQESSSKESHHDSSSQESSRPLICITQPKSRHFTKKSLQYS